MVSVSKILKQLQFKVILLPDKPEPTKEIKIETQNIFTAPAKCSSFKEFVSGRCRKVNTHAG